MKWRVILFWILVFAGIFFFFLSFAVYLFREQEEVQFFIPEWNFICEILLRPGGFCTMAGEFLIQHYNNALFAAGLNSSLLCGTGILCYLLLQRIVARGYNLLLSLVPVFGLLKMHIQPNYVVDGTLALFLMMVFLFVFSRLQGKWKQVLYAVLSTVILYLVAEQLALLYSIVLVVFTSLCKRKVGAYLLIGVLAGGLLVYTGIRCALYIPLIEGLYAKEYHEIQLQSSSYIYYVWLRFTLILSILFIIGYLISLIPWKGRWRKSLVTGGMAIPIFIMIGNCLPDPLDISNRMMCQLTSLARQEDWDTIIRMHQQKKITGHVSRNFLNMALAQKGMLGDKLFYFDQKGSQGLLAPWNRTYFMSVLLSDIHFMTGDISLSESYAMEGFTLVRRKGSPRMMQRLVQISLIKREWAIAEKYIDLLHRMPYYRGWAEKHRRFIRRPEQLTTNRTLALKRPADPADSNLLCLMDMESIWLKHLSEPTGGRIAFEYLGCSYLLAKEMQKFKALLIQTGQAQQGQPLPVHFQEAVLILSLDDPSILNVVSVQPSVSDRFKQYRRHARKVQGDSSGLASLYQLYGNTCWFYYYYKQL